MTPPDSWPLPRHARVRRWLIPVLFVLSAGALQAQSVDTTTFPPVPSSRPLVRVPLDPADSGFGEWRKIPVPRHDKTPAAWTLRAGDWDFLMATPRAMDAMDTSRIIDTTLANCRAPLNISAADSASVATMHPWAAFDSVVNGRPVIVISIMPVLRNFTECGFKNFGRPAMIRRGVRFVTEFSYDASRDPVSAVVLSRLRAVNAVMLARASVVVVARGGIPGRTTDQLRLYIPYDAIAPTATGDMPQVELLIWTRAGGEPDHIPLPNNIVRAVWWDFLRWRAARLASRDDAMSAAPASTRPDPVRVPTPGDTGLRTALVRESDGRFGEAATIMLERLADEHSLSTNDRRIALMSMARAFQADDDPSAAALVASELTAMDPCALSGSATSSRGTAGDRGDGGANSVGFLLDRTRPAARCTAFAPGAAFLRGLIVPGGGQYMAWSHLIGISAGALTIAGIFTAVGFEASANQRYAHYQTTLDGTAEPYFQSAVDQQTVARTLAISCGVFWLASAIEAEVQERIHASRLAAVHEFWFRPILAPSVEPGRSPLGVAGGITFHF